MVTPAETKMQLLKQLVHLQRLILELPDNPSEREIKNVVKTRFGVGQKLNKLGLK